MNPLRRRLISAAATRRVVAWIGVVAIASCTGDTTLSPKLRLIIAQVSVSENPANTLSLIVAVTTKGADSVRVRYASAIESETMTPFARPNPMGLTTIAVVGLSAMTAYSLTVEALNGGSNRVTSAPRSATTGALPLPLRSMRFEGTGRATGRYTLVVPMLPDTSIAADGFVVAFDANGEVRWYHRFPGAWPVEAKQQRNGNITVFVGRSYGWQRHEGAYVELTPGGAVVRTHAVAQGFFTDPHELLLSFQDTTVVTAHLLGYEIRDFDLSSIGGGARVPLAVHTIERHAANGALRFRWSAGSLFGVADWPLPNPRAVDLSHPSSLAIAPDGSYVVSFQAMDEITKVDSATGAVVWRLGGRHNQFMFRDDPKNGFLGQHHVQVLDNGNLLMLDDRVRGTPGSARGVEYAVDTKTMTARLVWQYQPDPPVISPIMGSVQRLTNGATLVGFGAAGRIHEVASDGQVLWSASLRTDAIAVPLPFYRAMRIGSLYRYVDVRGSSY